MRWFYPEIAEGSVAYPSRFATWDDAPSAHAHCGVIESLVRVPNGANDSAEPRRPDASPHIPAAKVAFADSPAIPAPLMNQWVSPDDAMAKHRQKRSDRAHGPCDPYFDMRTSMDQGKPKEGPGLWASACAGRPLPRDRGVEPERRTPSALARLGRGWRLLAAFRRRAYSCAATPRATGV